jgi:hypothetical protein
VTVTVKRRAAHVLLPTAAAVAVALATPRAARADEPPPTAESLFDKGRKLMEKTATLDEACLTLEASLRFYERGDTLLNLAECHRRQGKTASAWAEFDRALHIGTRVNFTEAIKAATKLRDELAAKLSKVTVTVSPETAALPELAIVVNGRPYPKEKWNSPIATDPGPLELKATATGYLPFSASIVLGDDKDMRTIVVQMQLVPPPAPPPPPPPPAKPVAVRPARPIWPWIVGGAGVLLGATAIGFEVDSRSAGSTLDSKCGPGRTACPVGFDFSGLRSRETRGYDLFVGLGAAGVAAIGAAAIGLGVWARDDARARTGFVFSPTSAAFTSSF